MTFITHIQKLAPKLMAALLLSAPLMIAAPLSAQDATGKDSGINSQISRYDLKPMLNEELRAVFAGKTHKGVYKDVRERTGSSTFTETTHADGTTDYQEGAMKLKGRWITAGDTICYKYDDPVNPGPHCFKIYEVGTCLYGYNPRATTSRGPIDPNYWSVKSLREGDISTCDDLLG